MRGWGAASGRRSPWRPGSGQRRKRRMDMDGDRVNRGRLLLADRRCSRRATLRAGAAGLAASALVAAAPRATNAQAATPAASPVATSGDFAGLVDVGGRKVYLECHGMGSPTVVLIAGSRSSARYWTDDLLHPDAPRQMVMPGVAAFTRVYAYDRPGTYAEIKAEIVVSRSDPVAQPRTIPQMGDELHALLQAAKVPGPYVLVGHSLGGFLARFYAATYPDEVVGLVLVDAYTEFLEDVMAPAQWQALVRLNQELGSDVVVPIPGYG